MGTFRDVSDDDSIVTCGVAAAGLRHHHEDRRVGLGTFQHIGSALSPHDHWHGGVDPDHCICMSYQRKRAMTDKGLAVTPKPRGLSGAGFWVVRDLMEVPPRPLLVGMVTSYSDKHHIIAGLHIRLVNEVVRTACGVSLPAVSGLAVSIREI